VLHSHLRAFARQFVASLPSRVHVLDAAWCAATRHVGWRALKGWTAALNCSCGKDSALVPKASSPVSSKYNPSALALEQ